MRHIELIALLTLQQVPGVGDLTARKLIAHCGSAEEVLRTQPAALARIDGVGSVLATRFRDAAPRRKAEAEADFISKNGITAHSFYDPEYPERLRHCADAPLVLFSSGPADFANRHVISIVGTRQITAYGQECCQRLIADLTPLDPIIISGYAYGVDIAAHLAALDNGLQTFAVLAHGLDTLYPQAHRKYAARMKENGGFLSEFQSGTEAHPSHFVKRNRIVAGLSEATVVIESAEKGGSLITAHMAGDYDREVFAVPGRVTDRYSQGCNLLIKTQRAHVLTSAADLVYWLNWDMDQGRKPVQQRLFAELGGEEKTIHEFLHTGGKSQLDAIAKGCGLPISKTSSVLLALELKGAVRPLPGKWFEAL